MIIHHLSLCCLFLGAVFLTSRCFLVTGLRRSLISSGFVFCSPSGMSPHNTTIISSSLSSHLPVLHNIMLSGLIMVKLSEHPLNQECVLSLQKWLHTQFDVSPSQALQYAKSMVDHNIGYVRRLERTVKTYGRNYLVSVLEFDDFLAGLIMQELDLEIST